MLRRRHALALQRISSLDVLLWVPTFRSSSAHSSDPTECMGNHFDGSRCVNIDRQITRDFFEGGSTLGLHGRSSIQTHFQEILARVLNVAGDNLNVADVVVPTNK